MQKISHYTDISLFFLGFNFFLFLFSPYSANYSLIALVIWSLASFYYNEEPKDYKNIYPYGVLALFVFLTISILRNQTWSSFIIFIPFVIPLLVFWMTISLQVRDYSKGLLALCVLYLAVYVNQFFLPNSIISIRELQFDNFFSIILIFFPIFLAGIFERKMPYGVFWKPIHIIFSGCLFFLLLSSSEIVIWLLLLFSLILVVAPKMYRFGFTTLVSFWIFIFLIYLVWDNINLSGALHNDITGLFQLWKFDFIENFSWFGTGEWSRAGKNTYHQFYLSFADLGVLRIHKNGMSSHLIHCHFKGSTSSGRSFFKKHKQIFMLHCLSIVLRVFFDFLA